MSNVTLEIRSAAGGRLQETLRFLRAEIRKRHAWGSLITEAGGGGPSFHSGYYLGLRYQGKQVRIHLSLATATDKTGLRLCIKDTDGQLNDSELKGIANSILFSAVDAARANAVSTYWVRRCVSYAGRPLEGWYRFSDWRIAPNRLLLNGGEPHRGAIPQVAAIDVRVIGIDTTDAVDQAWTALSRRAAHAAFLLNLPLHWLSGAPVIVAGAKGEPVAANSWRGDIGVVDEYATPFSDPTEAGAWGKDFLWPWRDPENPSAPPVLRFPQTGLSLLRRLEKIPTTSSAFDASARLYHLSLLLPPGFHSATIALQIASIEALTHGFPEFTGSRDKGRFTAFFRRFNSTDLVDPDVLYSRWRSGLFHAGRFARIDGGDVQIDYVDDSRSLNERDRIAEHIRRAYAGWVGHVTAPENHQ